VDFENFSDRLAVKRPRVELGDFDAEKAVLRVWSLWSLNMFENKNADRGVGVG
jgi:hypothetical protein